MKTYINSNIQFFIVKGNRLYNLAMTAEQVAELDNINDAANMGGGYIRKEKLIAMCKEFGHTNIKAKSYYDYALNIFLACLEDSDFDNVVIIRNAAEEPQEEVQELTKEVEELEEEVKYWKDAATNLEDELDAVEDQLKETEATLAQVRAEAAEASEKYDYEAAIRDDVEWFYNENKDNYKGLDREELQERLFDDCWCVDSVTGNASGSYTCNAWKAEHNLCHNWELLVEACQAFGCLEKLAEEGAEWADVTIRCHLLTQVVAEFVEGVELPEGWQMLVDGENEEETYYEDESEAVMAAISTIEADLYAMQGHISQEDFAEYRAQANKAFYDIENDNTAEFNGKTYEVEEI